MKVEKWIKLYKYPIIRRWAYNHMVRRGCDIDVQVKFGENDQFPHNGRGVGIHPMTVFEDDVRVYNFVEFCRGDVWNPPAADFEGFHICKGAIIGAGAKLVSSHGLFTVGENSIVGVNSVLTHSIGPNEIWAGNPAVFIKKRVD